jgi:hypothetical protein
MFSVLATFIGEITYKGRSFKEVMSDYKRVLARCTILFGIFCIAGLIYSILGIKFE